MNELKDMLPDLVKRFKFPLLFLSIGLLLMLIPTGKNNEIDLDRKDVIMGKILSNAEGIGDCIVLISDKGVVVVCEGADKAKARLEIIQAISSYTGYSSEKITILKMLD